MKMKSPINKPMCSDCVHFFVTYEQSRPWGCRHFGFKAKKIPAQVVLETSGTNCASKIVRKPLGRQKRKAADGK